jgi:site-specific recombinase XerD
MRRIVQKTGVRLKNLWPKGHHPSGNVRYYYRFKTGGKVTRWPLPDAAPDSAMFLKAHAACVEQHKGHAPRQKPIAGTISAACHAYLASDTFMALAPSTRDAWRRQVRAIEADYGTGSLNTLRAQHIRQDLSDRAPHPANARLKAWRSLGRFWLESGLIANDPALAVRKRKTPKSDGFTPWDRDDVAKFRAFWPHDTPQRLAFELMHRSCASIKDACGLGRGMVRDGWLTYARGKSGSEAAVPWQASAAPDWFEWSDHLDRCLRNSPRHMTWIITASGATRSPKAAAQWFSAACRTAGLIGLSAHGIRKHRAAVFKENGATEEQRMAILGHDSASEATRYSKSADLKKIITGTQGDTSPEQGVTLVVKNK